MVMHQNSYGYWEDLDYLPVRDCCCDMCIEAAKLEDEESSSYDVARRAGKVAGGIISAAIGIHGAIGNPGLAAGALPGHQQDAQESATMWKNAARDEQRDRQSRDMDGETRAAGNRRRWSGKQ